MTIGDFSRATRLSAKALRFYHDVGVLEPASVDPSNGYRLYTPGQIAQAQVIRQLRQLSVPVETIREILGASDVTTRNGLISAHLARLEAELRATQAAVASLRGLLDDEPVPFEVEHRSVPATPALVIRDVIDLADLTAWYLGAQAELDAHAGLRDSAPAGPRGGLWSTDLFVHERGEAALFFPVRDVDGRREFSGRARMQTLPPVDLAVAVHRGPDDTMAQTYGALGAYVAEHEIGVAGPIRETYLMPARGDSADVVTEIGWPIFRTAR